MAFRSTAPRGAPLCARKGRNGVRVRERYAWPRAAPRLAAARARGGAITRRVSSCRAPHMCRPRTPPRCPLPLPPPLQAAPAGRRAAVVAAAGQKLEYIWTDGQEGQETKGMM